MDANIYVYLLIGPRIHAVGAPVDASTSPITDGMWELWVPSYIWCNIQTPAISSHLLNGYLLNIPLLDSTTTPDQFLSHFWVFPEILLVVVGMYPY